MSKIEKYFKNNSFVNEILEGFCDSDKNKIRLKAQRYITNPRKNKSMTKGVKIIINWLFGAMFDFELKKQIEINLLKINGLFE